MHLSVFLFLMFNDDVGEHGEVENKQKTGILDPLQRSDKTQVKNCQIRFAVVQSRYDKDLNNHLSGLCGEKYLDLPDVLKEKLCDEEYDV